jgi:hypothetical protein
VGVGSAVATAPEFELLLVVAAGFADLLAVAFLVEVAFVLVAAGVGESVAVATAVGVEAAIVPPPIAKDSVDENCGGVIAMTAPRPPKVPPAINNARFILYSLSSLLT